MRWGSIGMSQRTARTQYDKRGINEHRTADDNKTGYSRTNAFHVSGLCKPFYLDHSALLILGTLVHELSETVYLRMLTYAHGCYTFDISLTVRNVSTD